MSRINRIAVLQSHPIQYFAPLYRSLAKDHDIELTVLYCSRQGVDKYLDPGFGIGVQWDRPLLEGYNYKFLPNWNPGSGVGGFLSLINPSVVSELSQGQFDALWVTGHNYFTFLLAILAANVLRLPVMMRCETHLHLKRASWKRIVRRPVFKLLYGRFCKVFLAIGTLNREFYLSLGISPHRIFLVPYVVDNGYFGDETQKYREHASELKLKLGISAVKPVILFASKLIPRKRPMDLLLAYESLRAWLTDATLVFVGSGSEELALRDYVALKMVPDVHFMGFRNQTEIGMFYAIADIFVLPSVDEPWGLVINETMCAGLPIVASRAIGAVPDLVLHNTNGLLFDARDTNTLAIWLEKLVVDVDLRTAMGACSRTIIDGWDFDRCVLGLKSALASFNNKLAEQP